MMKLRRCTVEHPFGTIKHEILRNARLFRRAHEFVREQKAMRDTLLLCCSVASKRHRAQEICYAMS
jgi:hypothetical protein